MEDLVEEQDIQSQIVRGISEEVDNMSENQDTLSERINIVSEYQLTFSEKRYTASVNQITFSEKTDIVNEYLITLSEKVDIVSENQDALRTGNCVDLRSEGSGLSTVYVGDHPITVYCDQATTNGGWTVFLRRVDDSYNFDTRLWADFKEGFGDLSNSFWLGLENIYLLTTQQQMMLRVELEDFDGEIRYAEYDNFKIFSEATQYKLELGEYSGNAGDSLSYNNGQKFSTIDRDNDESGGHCAELYYGAWWYRNCSQSSLLGEYLGGVHNYPFRGLTWYHWRGQYYSYKRAVMSMRPVQ